ncbi:MAG: hybrid sensor histidine kinase/response regulator, partial [Rhizobiaceae bacterium]
KTFRAMARQQPAIMEPVNVKSVLATAIDGAGYGQKQDDLEIISNLPDDLSDILADADQITQVIINLVINAGHAISKSGTGNRIEVSAGPSKKGDSVEITVSDNGPGIAENIRARIFEPFFTTKEVGDGTGIGLAFCHRIIHSHGGQIRLDPDYSRGSRFCITLPVAAGAGLSTAEKTVVPRDTNIKRALIVDDEKDVAELITEILIRDGFQVDTAHSGVGALVHLEARSYDIVLSDLNMPDLDGRGLFEALEKSFPDLAKRIAFITGDTMGSASQKLLRESKRPYLEKPVSPTELRNLVHKILNDAKEAH